MRSVTRQTNAHTEENPSATIDKIVEAFERLLSGGESFTTISVEQLAREAGIGRATFYLHFRNKGELVSRLMQRFAAELRTAALASLHKKQKFGRAEFRAFMREVVEINFRHHASMRAMVEVAAYDATVAKHFQEFLKAQTADTRLVMSRLKEAGAAHPAATPILADILFWTTERTCAQLMSSDATPQRRQEIADALTHVVWSAIAKQ
jgi:AcrR family transcriptional regulator